MCPANAEQPVLHDRWFFRLRKGGRAQQADLSPVEPLAGIAERDYEPGQGVPCRAAVLDNVGPGPDCTFELVELVDSDLRRMSASYASMPTCGSAARMLR
jgi:hypothetical protein